MENSDKPKFLTKKGLSELGKIIRSSREAKGLNLRKAAEKIAEVTGESVKFTTLGEIERGIVMPQFNTLVAIAVSGLVTDSYGHTLSIYDFIDIASESPMVIRGIGMDTLIRLIEEEQAKRNITLSELASQSGADYKNLLEIMQGRETEDFEGDLILLSAILTNPQTGMRFGNPDDLAEFCQIKIPAHFEQESHLNSTLNGLCQ